MAHYAVFHTDTDGEQHDLGVVEASTEEAAISEIVLQSGGSAGGRWGASLVEHAEPEDDGSWYDTNEGDWWVFA